MADYRFELDVATALAREAGALLLNDFYLTGGPRGSRHKATADDEADQLICEGLLKKFPNDAYLGEEAGLVNAECGSDRIWIVDPNDGTAAYTRGGRGSAVSIALVEDGVPVLGVVFAFCYPDDTGDMISWCKGQMVRRNDVPILREWQETPTSQQTAIVSYKADNNAQGNASCTAPMRYRALPSIAYRLALVAVGEADAGVSATRPNSWDVAAGHALLIGAGADLYGQDGNPIRYEANGHRTTGGWTIGGSAGVSAHLLAADWSPVTSGQRRSQNGPYKHVFLESTDTPIDVNVLQRAQGCMLGQLAGDSLGSLVEFMTPQAILARHPEGVRHLRDGGVHGEMAGQPTDDSEMALLLARMLVSNQTYDAEQALNAYQYWLDSNPFDCGITISGALRGRPSPSSQANGAMMRISPLGIFGAGFDLDQVASWAEADAQLTHVHPICAQANALYAMAIADAVANGTQPQVLYEKICRWAQTRNVDADLLAAIKAAASGAPTDFMTHMGWVLIGFQNALWQLLHAPTLEAGVVNTVMRGGDTDTNASITGALLGAVYGRNAIPQQWQQALHACRPIAGMPGVKCPRPPCFWPVDALALSERLVRIGL